MRIIERYCTFSIGDVVIDARSDATAGQYEGAVRNRPYAVKLHAGSIDELAEKFERLFSRYLGLAAA